MMQRISVGAVIGRQHHNKAELRVLPLDDWFLLVV